VPNNSFFVDGYQRHKCFAGVTKQINQCGFLHLSESRFVQSSYRAAVSRLFPANIKHLLPLECVAGWSFDARYVEYIN
jgi:hypothetical protein